MGRVDTSRALGAQDLARWPSRTKMNHLHGASNAARVAKEALGAPRGMRWVPMVCKLGRHGALRTVWAEVYTDLVLHRQRLTLHSDPAPIEVPLMVLSAGPPAPLGVPVI